MSDTMDIIDALPDISFIDDISLEDLQRTLITSFQEKYEEITGEPITLARADPNRIILLAVAQYLYQGLLQVDKAGKMNFLKYAYGDYLKNLAALKGVTALEPKAATVDVKWSLEEIRAVPTVIPAGTRVTADMETFFAVVDSVTIPAGSLEATGTAQCTETGTQGNGFAPGEINTMADPVAFIASVVNVSESSGGTDEETDESLAERTFLAPSGYSVAGSAAAYKYHIKTYDPNIGDIRITSPSPGVVDIRFVMSDGSIPASGEIAGLTEYLSSGEIRPLTDYVQVSAPETVSYEIEATYYITSDLSSIAPQIQSAVTAAVDDYVTWQKIKIGRDVNPSEFVYRMIQAGAKRVEITSPERTEIEDTEIAICSNISLTYGGIESD